MQRRNFLIWTGMLGFALGGFFDGIVLHQILQWHHLMSLVPGFSDLRTLVLWDGLFHVVTYALAALALWGMWRTRGAADMVGARTVTGAWLLGFATWQAVDAVVFHWLLRIHRIRVDTDAPLLWDLGWLAVFGLIPGLLGWMLLRSAGGRAADARSPPRWPRWPSRPESERPPPWRAKRVSPTSPSGRALGRSRRWLRWQPPTRGWSGPTRRWASWSPTCRAASDGASTGMAR